MKEVIVSSSGKVLITGGYLILDQPFGGLSLGLDSRFYTIIKSNSSLQKNTIFVKSLQFTDKSWEYRLFDDKLVETLEVVFRYVNWLSRAIKLNQGIEIYLAADNDFYSQQSKLVGKSLKDIPKCDKFQTTLAEVNKTGLGSSATLVTSIVSSLLVYLFQADNLDLNLCHILSQLAHCRAQGKVGSGFDVASAVFGSINYTRFNPKVLNGWLEFDNRTEGLEQLVDPKNWDYKAIKLSLPKFINIKLVEVRSGSDTRSMVKSLLNWRNSNPELAAIIWETLNTNNLKINQLFQSLNELYLKNPESYKDGLESFPGVDGEVNDLLLQVQTSFKIIRQQYQKLTELCKVPIEPLAQTERLDYILSSNLKVLAAGVPGAGGNDALFVLYVTVDKSSDVEEQLEVSVHSLENCSSLLSRPLVDQDGTQLVDLDSEVAKLLLRSIPN